MLEAVKNNSHLILKVREDVMMLNSNEFIDSFQKLAADDYENISFNFFDVNFIDSSGIGALVKCINSLKSRGIKPVVFNLNKSLYSVFKLSGLNNLMKIYKDSDDFKKDFPEVTHGL